MKTLKEILYSLLLPLFFVLIIATGNEVKVKGENILLFGMLFLCFLVIHINNDAAIRYFWRIGLPEWMTTGQIWLGVLGIAVFSFACSFMFHIFRDKGTITYILIPAAVAGAYLYRYAYTRNAPDDLDAYEKERRYEEDPDALVTVAECNDTASAYIIKGVLESNEIPVEIFGDGLSETLGVGKHTVPIRIMVRRRDKETAEKLINE